ncbi:MAG: hypothetical protein M3416_03800 [Acidobacteriota bacterium]|nr:hypothetical protein [Acidobacteriota bacterium]
MATTTEEKERDNITINAPVELKLSIRVEGARRGQNISEAGEEILKLGLPLYLRQVPVVYQEASATAGNGKKQKRASRERLRAKGL